MAQAEIKQHFALLEGDQAGVEHGHIQTLAEIFVRLVHGSGSQNDRIRSIFVDGLQALLLQLSEHNLFLAGEQFVRVWPGADVAD